MFTFSLRKVAALLTLATVALSMTMAAARAESMPVDPVAIEILQEMTSYLGAQKDFSVHTQATPHRGHHGLGRLQ
jgi:hypothetical protein